MSNDQKSMPGVESVETASGPLNITEHTGELDVVTAGVHGLRTVMVNLFTATEDDGTWVLIDSGLPGTKEKIRQWVDNVQGGSRPVAILLTHGHFDHTGAVADLAREWSVPVYVHTLELPFVTGKREYPSPDPSVGGGVMSLLSPFFPKKPIDLRDVVATFPADGRVPGLPSWRWIHTPGHTDGDVSFFRERDRALIAGDAVTTTKQESFWAILRQAAELHGPPAYFTSDWAAAKESVRKLAQLQPRFIAAGHGKPIQGDAAALGLAELAAHFDELAAPKHHR
jgi:glyoxylase-like metal-dependent hydrolase (beta-lactamase superfamily II)